MSPMTAMSTSCLRVPTSSPATGGEAIRSPPWLATDSPTEPRSQRRDIFYYVYGLLHSADYRRRYSADLKKTMPGIPMVNHFDTFSRAGRDLADRHVGYETVEPWPTRRDRKQPAKRSLPVCTACRKCASGSNDRSDDKTSIVYNSHITLTGIPLDAYRYQVNGKSAIEWIMDRYQVRTDTKTGIVNDPNDWASEHRDPRYILDLLKRLVTVSIETMKIVDSLPALGRLV